MKGIILAGGSGTRLYPITLAISKQLMPIYDKPMIYYPLSTLMKAGIREILIITTPHDQESFKKLLGDGRSLGCRFEYAVQDKPRGLADAYIIGEKFIGNDDVAMILGDNLFYGSQIDNAVRNVKESGVNGALIFGYYVAQPHRYGIIEFASDHKTVVSLEEKPKNPKSNYAQTGIYFSDNRVIEIAKNLAPSERGEIEVTDAMGEYLRMGELKAVMLDRGVAWLDTGTFESMNEASTFIEVIEKRQGLKVGCIEEEAYRQGFIDKAQLTLLAEPLLKSGYGKYLINLN
jgi:glucose-1-phosphate thymidylyltransferase